MGRREPVHPAARAPERPQRARTWCGSMGRQAPLTKCAAPHERFPSPPDQHLSWSGAAGSSSAVGAGMRSVAPTVMPESTVLFEPPEGGGERAQTHRLLLSWGSTHCEGRTSFESGGISLLLGAGVPDTVNPSIGCFLGSFPGQHSLSLVIHTNCHSSQRAPSGSVIHHSSGTALQRAAVRDTGQDID